MRSVFSIIIFQISFSLAFGQKYLLDSTETHPYLKLTCYPFSFPEDQHLGSLAVGPSISLSGERLEIQIGVLYDLTKYSTIYAPTHASPGAYIDFHKWYLPLLFNYYFPISKRIKLFPSFGGGLLVSADPNEPDGWLFAGGGISYKTSNKIKLNLSVHERLATGGLSQGAFFEIAYQLK